MAIAQKHEREATSTSSGNRQVKTTSQFQPINLDRHPEVTTLLSRLGLGDFDRDTVTSPPGRNESWSGSTTLGREVFVKRLVGPELDVTKRIERLLAFQRFLEHRPALAAHTPAFLGADRESSLVVYEYVAGATGGAQLVVDQEFAESHAEWVGQMIGQLHNTTTNEADDLDTSPPPLPETDLLHGLPLPVFNSFSNAELEAWGLMQRDQQLVEALERLRRTEHEAPRVPTHCDLRVDQLLFTEHQVYVIDWEEFRLADPARDVGSFAGEWLHRSVLDIVTNRGDGDNAFLDVELTHEQVLQRGAAKMERLLPLFHAFFRGYHAVRTDLDPGFAQRVTAFAGWHLLDRLIAGARRSHRLSGIERAAAGVGRRAVLTPEKFVSVLGLEGM